MLCKLLNIQQNEQAKAVSNKNIVKFLNVYGNITDEFPVVRLIKTNLTKRISFQVKKHVLHTLIFVCRFKGETSDLNLNYESDDVSNSEDEYDDTERKLLEKVRKKRTRENFDSDDEVYGLQDENDNDDDDDEEDEKDSMASDIEGLEQDDDLPDERAWGKNKRSYYSTDYVDQDYASASHKDMAQAEMEEAEARNIQKRLAEQLDDADFGLDLFETEAKEVESDAEDEQIIKTDLSTLSKRQKQALMKKESPEFEALLGDFKGNFPNFRTFYIFVFCKFQYFSMLEFLCFQSCLDLLF